jgi:hypothetical protein
MLSPDALAGHLGAFTMAMGHATSKPQMGRRIWLGGEIVTVIGAIHGPSRVTIKLDSYPSPLTILWAEPDDDSIVYTDDRQG